jgi:hypothetical protein
LSNSPEMTASEPAVHPSVFISYRRLDDMPPPEKPNAKGFVRYFHEQLAYELTTLGLPGGVLWVDRYKVEHADAFTDVIAEELAKTDLLLAILSRNYIQSGWCQAEVEAFAQKLADVEEKARRRRIFRVDKQEIDDADLPAPLRGLQAVRFYEKDQETGVEQEYYYRGKVLRRTPYISAIREVALAIFRRLQELGVKGPVPKSEGPALRRGVEKNGRTVFVARPGSDLRDAYQTLVHELQGRGFTVAPDPERELPSDGAAAFQTVRHALQQSELSIHLLGERRGFQPEGLAEGIVGLQLAEAAAEQRRRGTFERLIWAPKVVPGLDEEAAVRDPLEVLDRFDERLPNDEVDGDTAARFNEFVLQRLDRRAPAGTAPRRCYVYIAALPVDQELALAVARRVKELGAAPIFAPTDREGEARVALESALLSRADHVLFCWGEADEASLLDALEAQPVQSWRAARPSGRLGLVVGPPDSATKHAARALGEFGAADLIVDATAEVAPRDLQPLLTKAR